VNAEDPSGQDDGPVGAGAHADLVSVGGGVDVLEPGDRDRHRAVGVVAVVPGGDVGIRRLAGHHLHRRVAVPVPSWSWYQT
jgi:hypothetical protein